MPLDPDLLFPKDGYLTKSSQIFAAAYVFSERLLSDERKDRDVARPGDGR